MDAVETGSLLLMVSERRRYTVPSRTTWRTIGQSGGMDSQRVEWEGRWARAFIVVSIARNIRGRVSRFRIGCFG